eukprot:TRINITY_DN23594_c0_g1_i1.p1 TRINITY_DN23594_c0_g1~~TRINITY_DN23594_c0_g1_i1.p1  ORF type:complete len:322 (-),score=81.43 TRINITY_DN23594_c0_g1_i1:109-1074(-)
MKRVSRESFFLQCLDFIKTHRISIVQDEERTSLEAQVLNKFVFEVYWLMSYLMKSLPLQLSQELLGHVLPIACCLIGKSRNQHKLVGWGILMDAISCSNAQAVTFHSPLIVQAIADQVVFREVELVSNLVLVSKRLNNLDSTSSEKLVDLFCSEYFHAVSGTYKDRPFVPLFASALCELFNVGDRDKMKLLVARNLKCLLSCIFAVINGPSQDVGGILSIELLSQISRACPERMIHHKRKTLMVIIEALLDLSSSWKDQETDSLKSCLVSFLQQVLREPAFAEDLNAIVNQFNNSEKIKTHKSWCGVSEDLGNLLLHGDAR